MELASNKVPNTRIHERAAGRVLLGLVNGRYIRKLFSLILTKNNNNRRFCDSNNATVIS